MPRYFFDTHDGFDLEDSEGLDLENPEAARDLALVSISEMMANRSPRLDEMEFRCGVRDESGHTFYTVRLVIAGTWHEA